jgi:tetratricopeptide (TPR) repeat protein
VVLLLIFWKRARISWPELAPTLPFFAVGLFLALRTSVQEQERVQAVGPEWDLSFMERVLVAGRAIWFYVYELVWPAQLVFIYERWQLDTGAWWQYLFPVGVAIALAALFLWRHRIGRGPVVAACIFCGTLTPALGFFNVYPMRYSFVADHFQYHASIALIALFAAAVVPVFQRAGKIGRNLGLPLAVFLLAVLGVRTALQCRIYKDLETLYSSILESVPESWFALNNLGAVYAMDHATQDRALELFAKAKKINPEMDREPGEAAADVSPKAFALFQVGVIVAKSTQKIAEDLPDQEKQRRLGEATGFFRRALQLDNDYKRAHSNLAGALRYLGDLDPAVFHFAEALRIDQKDDSLRIQLAGSQIALAQQHAAAGRQAAAHQAIQAATKNLRQTVPILEQALRDHPKDMRMRMQLQRAHVMLAHALRAQGLEQQAAHHIREARRIRGWNPDR